MSEPLSDEGLAELRDALALDAEWGMTAANGLWSETTRLLVQRRIRNLVARLDDAEAERDQLRAEVERLRDLLSDNGIGWRNCVPND